MEAKTAGTLYSATLSVELKDLSSLKEMKCSVYHARVYRIQHM